MAKSIKFEDKMNELSSIVDKLNDPETTLDDSIKLYELGLNLSKELSDQLKSFEKKVDEIKKGK